MTSLSQNTNGNRSWMAALSLSQAYTFHVEMYEVDYVAVYTTKALVYRWYPQHAVLLFIFRANALCVRPYGCRAETNF
jgi:hypothetical protein